MNASNTLVPTDSRLDQKAIRRAFDRAAGERVDERVVAAEIAKRMAERLGFFRLDPRRILDAGCGRVPAAELLLERFPAANMVSVDSSWGMLKASRRRESLWERFRLALGFRGNSVVCADIGALPIATASIDLIWSNLALAWVPDAATAFREFHRVLKADGLLMFSTYGPDTLRELRAAFSAADDRPHVHGFTDMHDLGDALLASGFADPVMDMEKLVCTYPDVEPLLREIRNSGQTNALTKRHRGLMGRGIWKAMAKAYARRDVDGRIEATIEIVHGHAWKISQHSTVGRAATGAATIKWLPSQSGLKRT